MLDIAEAELQAHPHTLTPPSASGSLANAARQAVLRRIAPALKHDMVVNLQAVSLMAEMLNARVERGGVKPADLQSNISKLNRLARDAVAGCLQVMSWIEGGDDDGIQLQQGVRECVALLSASLNFRGFSLVDEVATAAADFEVRRNALRTLLCGSLLALADGSACPCELVVESDVTDEPGALRVRCRPRTEQPQSVMPPASAMGPRPQIDWAEVQALAATEGVALQRGADHIRMRLPRAVVTSPVQMAPV